MFRVFFIVGICLTLASHGEAQSSAPPDTHATDELTMDQAIDLALKKNLDLIAERYNVPIAQAQIITASLRPNPIVSLEGDHLKLLPGYGEDTGAGPSEYAIRTDFIFERGGKRQRRLDVAQAVRSVAELQLLNTIRTVLLDVQTAFVDVLQAKADLALALENLRTFEEITRINQARVKSGDLAEVELVRSQVAQLQFENTARQAELQVRTARARLQLLIGRGKGDRPIDAAGEMRREEKPLMLDSLRENALKNRPDLLAQERDQIRSQAELRLQLAQSKVDYSLGTEYRRQEGLTGRGNSLGFFFQTSIPLFNRNQGEIARARQEQLQAAARIHAVEATVENDVEVAYLQYRNAVTTLERTEKSLLPKARDVRQITEYSYRRGEASFLEFLDAQRAYNETVQAYNQARGDFARSLYGIDAAIGTKTSGGNKP